jgi:Uma2 family endonuclease
VSTAHDDILRRHRLTVGDYYRMAEAGILRRDDRVELIEGTITDVAPIGSAHATVVRRLNSALIPKSGDAAIVSIQSPVSLGRYSAPEPDVALLQPRADEYAASHPTAADIILLIEVADTTLRNDRDIKIPLYARHGIPEASLVDIDSKNLPLFLEPTERAYALEILVEDVSRLAPSQLPDIELDLSELFTGL